MAVVKSHRRRSSKRRTSESSAPTEQPERAALLVFALLTVAAPLAFGAVDRFVQLGLLLLLAAGLFLRPPEVLALSPRATRLLLAGAGVLVLKEFAPAALFGGAQWRAILTGQYGMNLPWTHHPEPGRAVDGLLTAIVAALWFLWVRTLAGTRANRPVLAWALFGSAAVVAAVSFWMHGGDTQAIYGLRYTPGWRGFGPFPNRNHTASFMAMGALLGCGCLTWAGLRERYVLLATGLGLMGLTLAALLTTQSRGGLISLGAGLALYLLLVVAKLRTRRTLAVVLISSLAALTVAAAFGAPLVSRFSDPSSDTSNLARRAIWHDTAQMWHDAPLFGHGLDSFTSVFPLYQTIHGDNQVVLHPESSWLQWLAELGLVPVAVGVLVLGWFLARQMRLGFARHDGFFLMAGAVAAVCALLAHAAVDVPAHRWGTAGFALAALALASPLPRRLPGAESEWNVHGPVLAGAYRRAALVPLAIAGFWALPLFFDAPEWSPLAAARLTARAATSTSVPVETLEQTLHWFPLDANFHHLLGIEQLQASRGRDPAWRTHFRIAARLQPGSWSLPIMQARACTEVAPEYALEFWQESVDRGGFRAAELFDNALRETVALPGAAEAWRAYVQRHPELALIYARTLSVTAGREFFDLWWRERALPPRVTPTETEIADFYALAARWATPAQLEQWRTRFAARTRTDYPRWAAVLHAWHDDAGAWELLSTRRPEPPWPEGTISLPVEQMRKRWEHNPDDLINAQSLATLLYRMREPEQARQVVLAVALRQPAPEWFARKGAFLEATTGQLGQAVETMLRESPSRQ